MKMLTDVRFLAFYSGAATALVAVLLLTGFRQQESSKKFESPSKFESIDVQRINVVEPDGTLRMVISNKSAAPGAIIRGKEYAHPDRQSAGILFFNDEATENGGLIFGGAKGKDGKPQSYGHSQLRSVRAGSGFHRRLGRSVWTALLRRHHLGPPRLPYRRSARHAARKARGISCQPSQVPRASFFGPHSGSFGGTALERSGRTRPHRAAG